jgi:hypothetical protein
MLTCERNDAVSTNWPTVAANLSHSQPTTSQPMKKKEENYISLRSQWEELNRSITHPARKALKGKLVTSTQYTNWMTPDRTRKTRKASTSFKREGVVLRYADQSVCTATFDADVAEEEEVDDVGATVDVFARLDAPAVLGVAGACFAGVLGPAILSFSFALSCSNSVEENAVSVVVVVWWSSRRTCPKRRP